LHPDAVAIENTLAKWLHELAFEESPRGSRRIGVVELPTLDRLHGPDDPLLELTERLVEASIFEARDPLPRSAQICCFR
jgi:hypothetical protein